MSSQDRTSEFFGLCQSLPPPTIVNSSTNPKNNASTQLSTGRYSSTSTTPNSNDPSDELRAFHNTASLISRDIYSTSTLLNELTTLIHSRSGSLFVDETPKVNNLVLKIKTNIETLNAKLDDANTMIQRNKRALGKNSQKGMEVSNLVGQLQEEFVNTTKGFKDVLRVRSDKMKERTDKRNDLNGVGSNGEEVSLLGNKPKLYEENIGSSLNGFNQTNNNSNNNDNLMSFGSNAIGGDQGGFGMNAGPRLNLTSAILSQQHQSSSMPGGESSTQLPRPYGIDPSSVSANGIRNRYSNDVNSSVPSFSGSVSSIQSGQQNPSSHLPVYTPMDIQQMEEQSGQTQMMQLIPDQTYLRERADAMEAVETNIVELGTIFNKLAVMVNEHSEMVTRIDDNTEQASENMTLSLNTLTDTLDNLRSNRALFFKVMAVLVAFIIFFVIFFA